jgi:hypothetical protein
MRKKLKAESKKGEACGFWRFEAGFEGGLRPIGAYACTPVGRRKKLKANKAQSSKQKIHRGDRRERIKT